MIDANWMTFSSKADSWSYGDAGSHIIRCLQARATLGRVYSTQDVEKLDIDVRGLLLSHVAVAQLTGCLLTADATHRSSAVRPSLGHPLGVACETWAFRRS